MSFPYKNPISSIQLNGTQSVPRNNTYGTTFSVNNTGGYMEVFSLSDLYYTIPSGTTGSIEYSGNTIPIEFTKGTGDAWSPDVITLASDNISSGRRRLGMLAYVYEVDQVYQYHINDYETLFNAATASTGCAQVSDFGTTINNKTAAGQSFINSWTANTIEDVSGVTRANAVWRKFTTGASVGSTIYGSFYDTSGQTATLINTAYPMRLNSVAEASGITIVSGSQITFVSAGTFDIQFSAQLSNNGGGGSGEEVDIWLRQNGVNVPYTDTQVTVQSNNRYVVAAWDFLVTVTAGTYVQLMWATDNVNITLFAQASTAIHPEIPSLIVTVIPVSGSGGTGGGGTGTNGSSGS